MNKKRLLITIAVYGVAFVIGYLVNFFLTRHITATMGTDAYGYVTLCKTIASYAIIATTALNSYSSRYIALSFHAGDLKQANVYYNSVFWTNMCVSLFCLVISFVSSPFVSDWISVPPLLVDDFRCLFVLSFCNLFITLISTAFQASSYIKDKLLLASICKGISYVVEALSLLFLYSFMKPRVYYTGIGVIAASLVCLFGYIYITKKFTPELVINRKFYNIAAVKKLVISGLWNSFNSLGNTLNSGLDLMISNTFLGGVAMGQVSIVKSIVNIFLSLFQMVAQPFQPGFLKLYAQKDTNSLMGELITSMKLSGMISNMAFAGVVAFGELYYMLWVPNEDISLLYRLSIIAVSSSILEGAVYPLYYIYTLTVRNKIPCIITIVGGLLNVFSMYLLLKHTNIGSYAVFITTAVVMTIISGITNPIYMSICLEVKLSTFYPTLLKQMVSAVVMTFCMATISNLFKPNSWISLIYSGLVGCIVCAILHLIIMLDKNDWSKITNAIKSYIGR